jgi:Pyruvate/2-oxoacid:ferredoxin oxidoreductase delta subunit
MSLQQKTLRVVLYEGNGAEPLESQDRFDAISNMLNRGYSVTRVAETGAVDTRSSGQMVVLGKFAQRGAAFEAEDPASIRIHDISTVPIPDLENLVESDRAEFGAAQHGGWKPWFPVIDYDRCTNCMQCLSFCLFGVYGVDADRQIQVQNNDNCKTNCPACSRVCPEAAIMFPKYKAGPINGDKVSSADLQREKMKIDISALLGGDIYQMLRVRSEKAKSRFSKERDSDKALNERQKCLVKLAQSGDIPMEVLMSLPSPEEIQKRAAEAAAKAQSALQPLKTE